MRRKPFALLSVGAAVLLATLYLARDARATPSSGFAGTTLAMAPFGEIEVFNHFVPPGTRLREHDRDIWLSWQKTKGQSDLYVQTNTWQPGGTTGWHSHPGHSLIIVTAGTVTAYEGNDPDCKPSVYTAGMGFVDPGGDHTHVIRNEGTEVAQTVAVQLIPSGQPRRIDVPDPGNCPF
jgi:uncharacterized RmlC-like cupin family protein